MHKVDLFASSLFHQLPQYFAWKLNLFSQATSALQLIWGSQFLNAFSPFYKPWRKWVTSKQKKCCLPHNFAFSNLVPPSSRNLYSLPIATSKKHKFRKPTTVNSSSSKKNFTTSGVSETAAQIVTSIRRKAQSQTANRPGKCGLAGVITTGWCISLWCNKNFGLSCFLILASLWVQDYWVQYVSHFWLPWLCGWETCCSTPGSLCPSQWGFKQQTTSA